VCSPCWQALLGKYMNLKAVFIVLIIFTGGCSFLPASSINSIEKALAGKNTLFLEDVKANKFEAIPSGYIAKYRVTSFGGKEYLVEDRFTGELDGGYLFKTYIDGKAFSDKAKMLKNGRYLTNSNGKGYVLEDGFDNCDIYFIGECKTKSSKIRTRSYSNGVWKYKYRSLGLTWITIQTIYDKYGLVLYRENVNSNVASPSKNAKNTTYRIQ